MKQLKDKEIKLLSQCPDCRAVKVMFPNDGRIKYQQSIASFEKLPKEKCPACIYKDKNK